MAMTQTPPARDIAVTIADIRTASEIVRGNVLRTPMIAAPRLSDRCGAEVIIKYENLQATGSFKDRGALVKMMSLSGEQRAKGVITMSAGNHAQAVAYHARRLGIPATIIMPVGTPFVKVGNTEALGGRVILTGESLSDAREETERLAAQEGLTMVHPYDDPLIIAGQGTVGLEILEDQPDLDCVVVPIGGGGLISGTAIALKHARPDIEVIGVEVDSYPSMYCAIHGQEPNFGGATLAEGIAVKAPGTHTVPIVQALVSDILLVSEESVEKAICAYAMEQKTMAEGAGAAGLAAVMSQPERFAGRRVGLVLCGGNIDPRILASVMVRGLERDGKIISVRIIIPDQPGVLAQITGCFGANKANILEVAHRRMFLNIPVKGAILDIVAEVKDRAHGESLLAKVEELGYEIVKLGDPAGREFGNF
jgi:threonine dehydratase